MSKIDRSRQQRHPLPALIQKILPPSPSKAGKVQDLDFDALFEELRIADQKAKERGTDTPIRSDMAAIVSSRPFQRIPKKNVKLPRKISAVGRPGLGDGLAVDGNHHVVMSPRPIDHPKNCPTSVPKDSGKLLRGSSRLPRRPPLPRWDLPPCNGPTEFVGSCYGKMAPQLQRT